jgi:tripartite tricarboxylate transporter family receptor
MQPGGEEVITGTAEVIAATEKISRPRIVVPEIALWRKGRRYELLIEMTRGFDPIRTAGQVVMMFGGPATIKPHVVNGRLRPIAVTGEKRNSAFPNLPTFDESGVPGVDSGSYWGSLAPAATPPGVIATLNAAMKASARRPTCVHV